MMDMYVILAINDEASSVAEPADDGVELIEGEPLGGGSLLIDVGAVHHLQDIVIIEVLVKVFHHRLEFLEVHDPVLVAVELGKDRLEAVLGLGLADTGADDVEELRELDGFVLVPEGVDEGEDEGIALVEAELIEDLVDFSWVNAAAAVLVEDVEGLLQLIVVLSKEAIFPGELGNWLLGRLCGGLCFGGSAHLNLNKSGFVAYLQI